jgi:lycopene cyclase domain-containing protein
MTYFGFHLVFILPLIGVLLYLVRQQGTLPYPRAGLGLLLICAIALVYTTPWDNYLVAQEIWTYDEGRILEQLRIGYVPLEEYLFWRNTSSSSSSPSSPPVSSSFLPSAAPMSAGRRPRIQPASGDPAWPGESFSWGSPPPVARCSAGPPRTTPTSA